MLTTKLIEAAARVRASAIRIITSTISGTMQEFSLTDLLPQPKQGIPG